MKPKLWFANLFAIVLATLAAAPSHAASVYLDPAIDPVSPSLTGSRSFELFMDFATNESTLGGGIDLKLDDSLSFVSFTPSTYFTTVADPAFSGSGTQFADNAYEIHFGSFTGLSGKNDLGTITLNLTQPLASVASHEAKLDLNINQHFGSFYSALPPYGMQSVTLTGAVITAVPEPEIAWMMLGGLAVVTVMRRRLGTSGRI
jgi:hypothetical protein